MSPTVANEKLDAAQHADYIRMKLAKIADELEETSYMCHLDPRFPEDISKIADEVRALRAEITVPDA